MEPHNLHFQQIQIELFYVKMIVGFEKGTNEELYTTCNSNALKF